MTNTFCCTVPSLRESAIHELVPNVDDAELLLERVTNSVVMLQSRQEPLSLPIFVVPQSGAIVGTGEGPLVFAGVTLTPEQ